jgi:hypothetical protein
MRSNRRNGVSASFIRAHPQPLPAVSRRFGKGLVRPGRALDLESDPVANGWATSLAHPGGNVTGIFLDLPGFNAKTLQLLREVVPRLRHQALQHGLYTSR